MKSHYHTTARWLVLLVGLIPWTTSEMLQAQEAGSKGHLLVTSFDNHSVFRYDAATGDYVDTFIPHKSGGLVEPWGILFGPHDGQVYVSSGTFTPPSQKKAVLRYDAVTGAYLNDFTESGHLDSPRGIIFGPDGHLYVADRSPADNRLGRVVRYHGLTGEFLDQFVPDGFVGRPSGLVFGPKGHGRPGFDLYVASLPTSNILQYDGTTGEFIGEFVPSGSGGLSYPGGLVFGPDGNLYVTVLDLGKGDSVLRYQGPWGRSPGAFMDAFVPPGSGGLTAPVGLLFGPDVNGDGVQDLYVTSGEQNPNFVTKPHTSAIKVYDGQTGAYLRDFVAPGSSRLDGPSYFTFTHTDPVTLGYFGD
jgi:DNA-binding beta-propeller fold protein YncE